MSVSVLSEFTETGTKKISHGKLKDFVLNAPVFKCLIFQSVYSNSSPDPDPTERKNGW